ncbi:MAG: Smr/MutS family protein [Deltaproteobacteria bacterium]|nr:Smr/MutS family protein [Deltaproteobacteria bacterium]
MDHDEPIEIPITDSLDLHTFRPKEVKSLLFDYFKACLEEGIVEVRVIHGKGTGRLKAGVLAFLERCELVESYSPADEHRGGWGATMVRLKKP